MLARTYIISYADVCESIYVCVTMWAHVQHTHTCVWYTCAYLYVCMLAFVSLLMHSLVLNYDHALIWKILHMYVTT